MVNPLELIGSKRNESIRELQKLLIFEPDKLVVEDLSLGGYRCFKCSKEVSSGKRVIHSTEDRLMNDIYAFHNPCYLSFLSMIDGNPYIENGLVVKVPIVKRDGGGLSRMTQLVSRSRDSWPPRV